MAAWGRFLSRHMLEVMVFVILAAWPFRPGSRNRNEAAAQMIFESDDHD